MSIVGKSSPLYNTVIIDAAIAHDRVFHIQSGTVTLANLSSITNGNSSDNGGGILNQGTLYLTNSSVNGNFSNTFGGGIANGGRATLTNSTVNANRLEGSGSGGGIWNYGVITLNNSTVSNNGGHSGGGIYNEGTLMLANSTVADNGAIMGAGIASSNKAIITHSVIRANTADFGGGGIYNQGTLTLTDSTISTNNTNTTEGGGILNSGTATLTNDTLNDNSSATSGGGIDNDEGDLTLTNSTLSDNTSGFDGGGILNFRGLGTLKNVTLSGNSALGASSIAQNGQFFTQTLTIENTIIAGVSNGYNCDGADQLRSAGYNLSNDGSCNLNVMSDLNNTKPKLGPLANNGGPTQTNALLAGSPAIDKIPFGSNGCGTAITTDQRGVPRPSNGKCDMGAYEANSNFVNPTPTATPCAGKPAAATLLKPGNGQAASKARVKLAWSAVDCATTYKVIVDAETAKGSKVDHTKETGTRYKTIPLDAGKPYYWRVAACNAAGCTNSAWSEFTRS